VWRFAIVSNGISFAGLALAIGLRHSDATWLVWLVYASAGLFGVAVLVTLFGISLIGE
jgi:hypothetical protein